MAGQCAGTLNMRGKEEKRRTPHIIIVGAGLAGISAAIALKKQLGFDNFTIYEKSGAIGGTWRDNTYPGCGSDVPAHWYSLSTELNAQWSNYYVTQPEIRAYWEGLYHKHGLPAHTHLGATVISAKWDNDRQLYSVAVEKSETAERSQVEAEIMIWAIGGFMDPVFPKDVPGTEEFAGVLFHSARWRHDVDLRGKRVGVIGNGCSAAQFIPQISEDPSVKVVNFCRTPQWFIPRSNYTYPRWLKWIFSYVPFVMRWHRNIIWAQSDMSFLIFRKGNTRLLALTRKRLTEYIKHKAPRNELENLIPKYAPGCKRIIVDPDYLSSLHRPNVSLNWETIDEIVAVGIKLKTGEIVPLDVIIFGTGYSIEPENLDIRGSRGGTLREYFGSKNGPQAYLGSLFPGFPNLFMLLGPNVASGHASVIFSQEAQIQLALQLIKPIVEDKAKSFEVRDEPTNEYNAWLQERISTSVWTDCKSYYQRGDSNKGKNIATFPGPVTLFWWMTRKPQWEDLNVVGASGRLEQRKTDRFSKRLITLILALTFCSCFLRGPLSTIAEWTLWLQSKSSEV